MSSGMQFMRGFMKQLFFCLVVLQCLAGFCSAEEPVICAAVVPCHQGEVLPQYQGGPCEAVYAKVCAAENESEKQQDACLSDRDQLEKDYMELSVAYQKLQRKYQRIVRR